MIIKTKRKTTKKLKQNKKNAQENKLKKTITVQSENQTNKTGKKYTEHLYGRD